MPENSESQQQIALTDDQGHKRIYNVLLTFKSQPFHKSYILIYPTHIAAHQEVGVKAFSLPFDEDPANPITGHLKPIKTKKEWDMVEGVMNALLPHQD